MSASHFTGIDTEGTCHCGLHHIPAHIDGVIWYWARHARDACKLDLPDTVCSCGRRRSEHQDEHGHAPKEIA